MANFWRYVIAERLLGKFTYKVSMQFDSFIINM